MIFFFNLNLLITKADHSPTQSQQPTPLPTTTLVNLPTVNRKLSASNTSSPSNNTILTNNNHSTISSGKIIQALGGQAPNMNNIVKAIISSNNATANANHFFLGSDVTSTTTNQTIQPQTNAITLGNSTKPHSIVTSLMSSGNPIESPISQQKIFLTNNNQNSAQQTTLQQQRILSNGNIDSSKINFKQNSGNSTNSVITGSNVVSAINLKSISPQSDSNGMMMMASNQASTVGGLQKTSRNNQNQTLVSSTSSTISNYAKTINPTSSAPIVLPTFNMKTISSQQHQQQFLNNIVNLSNSNVTSQTIAQLCSTITPIYQMRDASNPNSVQIPSFVQAMPRFSSSSPSNNCNQSINNNNNNNQRSNSSTQSTTSNYISLNTPQFNSLTTLQNNQNQAMLAFVGLGTQTNNLPSNNSTNSAPISSLSPLKPNIIRKSR